MDTETETVTLFHGTSHEGHDGILESGEVYGPVYMTSDRSLAEKYILDWEDTGVIVKITVPVNILKTDMEHRNDDPGAVKVIENGGSVYTESSIPVENCSFEVIDYS